MTVARETRIGLEPTGCGKLASPSSNPRSRIRSDQNQSQDAGAAFSFLSHNRCFSIEIGNTVCLCHTTHVSLRGWYQYPPVKPCAFSYAYPISFCKQLSPRPRLALLRAAVIVTSAKFHIPLTWPRHYRTIAPCRTDQSFYMSVLSILLLLVYCKLFRRRFEPFGMSD